MGTFSEIRELPEKYLKYKEEMMDLFRDFHIDGVKSLVSCYQGNSQFREAWSRLWLEIASAEGGKLSFTTMGLLIGSALGGVGVATMGSAFGVPLAVVLGLGGFLSGSKIDSLKVFSGNKQVTISVEKALYSRIELDAQASGIKINALLEKIIEQAYAEDDR